MSQIKMSQIKLTTALVVGAAVWPAGAYATPVDLHSPDARDAARAAAQAQSVDLRSPDARDAGRSAESQSVDLRSPDARDAGRAAPQNPASPGNSSGNLDWRYLAIGGLGSILIVGVTVTSTRRRRRRLARAPVVVRG